MTTALNIKQEEIMEALELRFTEDCSFMSVCSYVNNGIIWQRKYLECLCIDFVEFVYENIIGVGTGAWRHPLTSLYEMIRYVRFMYVCDLARIWHPPNSYGVHTLLF